MIGINWCDVQPERFVAEAQRDGLAGLIRGAALAWPGRTLSLLAPGLEPYLVKKERSDFRQGGLSGSIGFSRAPVDAVV